MSKECTYSFFSDMFPCVFYFILINILFTAIKLSVYFLTGFVLSRKVTESCTISNIPFHKGTAVFVPAYTIHHDAEYWPEPEAFKPERFLPENKESITPFTYMPFGDGPRSCVAMRFAYMEMKTVLVRVLQKYRFVRGPETSVPIKVKPRAVLAPGEPVLVRVEKRDD